MILYAIRNKKNKKLLTGTNYNVDRYRQLFNKGDAPLLFTEIDLMYGSIERQFLKRNLNKKEYKIIKMNLEVCDE